MNYLMKEIKSKKRIRLITTVVIVVCSVTLLISAGALMYTEIKYKESSEFYNTLRQYTADQAFIPGGNSNEQQDIHGETDGSGQPDSQGPGKYPSIDFESLREINPDIVAWLICEDTAINYPVVHGSDNSYYLTHLFDLTRNNAGCLFVDMDNSSGFMDKNTIIYGHNMSDGSMFNTLGMFKEQAFFEANPQMLLITPDATYIVELFAGFVADIQSDAWRLDFNDDTEFAAWVESVRGRSAFQSDVSVEPGDRVITLSTCTYERDNVRYILVGKLVLI